MEPGSLKTFSAITYQCFARTREERPTMVEVLNELQFALQQQASLSVLLITYDMI